MFTGPSNRFRRGRYYCLICHQVLKCLLILGFVHTNQCIGVLTEIGLWRHLFQKQSNWLMEDMGDFGVVPVEREQCCDIPRLGEAVDRLW